MSRFYVPREAVAAGKITVTGNEAHHILDVMRLKVSDRVVCFDGTGNVYAGIIREIGRKTLIIEVTDTRKQDTQSPVQVTLIQALPKKEKMDYIVEKATELGVHAIVPVTTERTIVQWDEEKKVSVVERWRKIAKEAAKQCGRADIPRVEPVHSFEQAVKSMPGFDRVFLAALTDETIPLKDAVSDFKGKSIAVAIGPEGDFTPEEVAEVMKNTNVLLVSLGPRVLKSDTAGLAVLAILNHEYA